MKCCKYTIVCPGGGDKLETSTQFMGIQSILLLLILFIVLIPLLGGWLEEIRKYEV